MSCQNTPTSQRGFTALELIIVLIIGFSIIGLSAGKMADMMDSSKSVRAMDSIVSLSTALKSLSSPQGYGAANDNLIPHLINSDTQPKSLKLGPNDTLLNQWNQSVTAIVNADIHRFTITYPGVTRASCNKLIKDLLGNFAISIQSAGGAAVPVVPNATTAQIVTSCNVPPRIDLVLVDL